MAYRGQGQGPVGVVSRPMDGGDPRTPMAWQHRDNLAPGTARSHRSSPGRNGGYSYRYTYSPPAVALHWTFLSISALFLQLIFP